MQLGSQHPACSSMQLVVASTSKEFHVVLQDFQVEANCGRHPVRRPAVMPESSPK